jgi:molybdopterin-guanine dinucleotide biosynthesis protein A
LLILAGGQSRRMGRDKANLPAGPLTLVEHLASRLEPVVEEILVSVGEQKPLTKRLKGAVIDRFPGRGPLAGMHAGFLAARYPLVWVVACDLPEVEPALGPLLCRYAGGVQAVVPRIEGQTEGLCALYRRELASGLERFLQAGVASVKGFLDGIEVRYLQAAEIRTVDPTLSSFRNLNTPDEYEAWLRSR